MTASTLIGPSVTVWILRTVVSGGTSLEELSDWTGHWPCAKSQEGEQMAEMMCHQTFLPTWLFISSVCKIHFTLKYVLVLQAKAPWFITHQYSLINTHTLIPPKNLFFFHIFFLCVCVRHCIINICFRLVELDVTGTLWCQYRDQFSCRFSLYTPLSWPEIPQPTLVNTPMDLKTNCAAPDKHVGLSRLYSKGHKGHYRVNAPIDSIPLSLTVNSVRGEAQISYAADEETQDMQPRIRSVVNV